MDDDELERRLTTLRDRVRRARQDQAELTATSAQLRADARALLARWGRVVS